MPSRIPLAPFFLFSTLGFTFPPFSTRGEENCIRITYRRMAQKFNAYEILYPKDGEMEAKRNVSQKEGSIAFMLLNNTLPENFHALFQIGKS